MNLNEILTKIDTYFEQHLKPNVAQWSIHQEPYKSDSFNLCVEAYQHGYFHSSSNPRLPGDALKDHFLEKMKGLRRRFSKKNLNC